MVFKYCCSLSCQLIMQRCSEHVQAAVEQQLALRSAEVQSLQQQNVQLRLQVSQLQQQLDKAILSPSVRRMHQVDEQQLQVLDSLLLLWPICTAMCCVHRTHVCIPHMQAPIMGAEFW